MIEESGSTGAQLRWAPCSELLGQWEFAEIDWPDKPCHLDGVYLFERSGLGTLPGFGEGLWIPGLRPRMTG